MYVFFFFFFQAEDGIRDLTVTGVQTCALPISRRCVARKRAKSRGSGPRSSPTLLGPNPRAWHPHGRAVMAGRSRPVKGGPWRTSRHALGGVDAQAPLLYLPAAEHARRGRANEGRRRPGGVVRRGRDGPLPEHEAAAAGAARRRLADGDSGA